MPVTWTTAGSVGDGPDWGLLDFPVEVRPVEVRTSDGVEVDVPRRALVRLREDVPRFVRMVGEGYEFVPHRRFFGVMDTAVRAQHRPASVETLIGRAGARARVTWTLPVVGEVSESRVLAQVVAFNGYDGQMSMSAQVAGGVPSAGSAQVRAGGGVGSRHRGRMPDDDEIAGWVTEVLARWPAALERWRGWGAVPVSEDRFVELLDRRRLPRKVIRRARTRFAERGSKTLWDACLALTWCAEWMGDRTGNPNRVLERREHYHNEAMRLVKEAL